MSGPAIGAHAPAGASARVVSLLLGLLVAVFIAWPLAHLVVQALTPGPQGAGGIFYSYREAFTSPVAASAIWGTAWLTVTSLCFGIPLALLLVEGVLSRVFSHASVRRAAPVEAAVAIVGRVRPRVAASSSTPDTVGSGGGRA